MRANRFASGRACHVPHSGWHAPRRHMASAASGWIPRSYGSSRLPRTGLAQRTGARATGSTPPLQYHPVAGSYCMVASLMSLQLHERGNHVVCTGGTGGGQKYQGALQSVDSAWVPGVTAKERYWTAQDQLELGGSSLQQHERGIQPM